MELRIAVREDKLKMGPCVEDLWICSPHVGRVMEFREGVKVWAVIWRC